MEASHASLAKPTVCFCNGSFPNRSYTFSTQFSRKPAKKLKNYSVSFLKFPSWDSFAARRRTKLLVYSQFRRPPRRRNSLREKYIPRQDQVRLFPEVSNPESNFESLGVRDHENDARRLGMDFESEKESDGALDSKEFDFSRNSALWNKLDNWVGRYKEDSEFWGIGAGPIFTIVQNSDGNVIRASIHEDEILKRSRIREWSLEGNEEGGELKDVNSKVSIARLIAKEIEIGAYQMPRNSSIARFVVEGKSSSLVGLFHAFSSRRKILLGIFPRIAFMVLCCFCVLGAMRKLFVGYGDVELTREEAEMLKRKKKSRMEKYKSQRGSVEVLKNGDELPVISGATPQFDRDELMKSMMQAKKFTGTSVLSDSSSHFTAEKHNFDKKVSEIRDMARKVRELERKNQSSKNHTGEQDELSSVIVDPDFQTGAVENHAHHKAQSAKGSLLLDNDAKICKVTGKDVKEMNTLAEEMTISKGILSKGEPLNNFGISRSNNIAEVEGGPQKPPVGTHMANPRAPGTVSLSNKQEVEKDEVDSSTVGEEQTIKSLSIASTNKKGKAKIITSLKEAKEYLSSKRSIVSDFTLYGNDEFKNSPVENEDIIEKNGGFQNGESSGGARKVFAVDGAADLDNLQTGHDTGIINPSNDCVTSGRKNHNATLQHNRNQSYTDHSSQNKQAAKSIVQVDSKLLKKTLSHTQGFNMPQGDQLDHVVVGRSENVSTVCDAMTNETEAKNDPPAITASNFLGLSESAEITQSAVSVNFDPVAVDFSFDASKAEDALNDLSSEVNIPSNSGKSNSQNGSLPKTSGKSWTDENFQEFDSVIKKIGHGFKDNYMLAKVKAQENAFSRVDMSKLGLWGQDEELEWMKDENLREIVFQVRENELAGRDPFHLINADDQKAFFQGLERKAEKANEKLAGVHEWIHSRIDNLDYGADGISLDDPLEKIIPRWKGPPIDQDPEFLKKFANIGILDDFLRDKQENLQQSQNLANSYGVSVSLSQNGSSTAPRTLIECSDGSNRRGDKKSKEHWQHTKKWSQGFIEVYNAETDPEVKSILKDMGKDLDRWITEKDRKDVADLLTKMPKKRRRFLEKKMSKIKGEVEKYGTQAVISKYKEYADEKEEDFLWWLDLRFVLCIELYSVEDGVPRVGFYSLEMAEDLELNPKQFHVIAFEDPGDSKNLCHIVQAQMDMLGTGKAFVVARPPKDAFREAKANGFSITLIRKGEVKLNVDQTLEEVEEDLKEVGSKIYHYKIMKERGVDIRSLMKGVLAAKKS